MGKDPVSGDRWSDTWERLRGMTKDARAMPRALLATRVVRLAAVKVRRAGVRASARVAQRAERESVTSSEDDGADSVVGDDVVAMDSCGVGGEGVELGVGDEVGAVERCVAMRDLRHG